MPEPVQQQEGGGGGRHSTGASTTLQRVSGHGEWMAAEDPADGRVAQQGGEGPQVPAPEIPPEVLHPEASQPIAGVSGEAGEPTDAYLQMARAMNRRWGIATPA